MRRLRYARNACWTLTIASGITAGILRSPMVFAITIASLVSGLILAWKQEGKRP